MDNDKNEMYSRIFPFWDKLTQDEKNRLCTNSSEVKYKKGATIHSGSNECTGVIIVKSGCVRTYLLSDEGREITLYRMHKGSICMLSASCVLQSITFDVFVNAETDCVCDIINGNVFAEVAEKNIYVKNFALETAVEKFSDVVWVMQQILFMSFDRRLAIFLWDEISDSDSMQIKYTQEQIAKYMGSAREVVSRMLKYFVSEGIVSHSRGGITVTDKQKLKELAFKK